MSFNRPCIVCRVLQYLSGPIVARRGDLLVVVRDDPHFPLLILSSDGARERARAAIPGPALDETLLTWYLAGAIRPLAPQDERDLLRVA